MIKLTNIKPTDTIKQLRGQINAMQNEIMADQPFVGKAVNPTITFHKNDGTQTGSLKDSDIVGTLLLLCLPESNGVLPESNGVFIAQAFGFIHGNKTPTLTDENNTAWAAVNIPAVTLRTRDANISNFVSPQYLYLTGSALDSQCPPAGYPGDLIYAVGFPPVKINGGNVEPRYYIEEHGTTCKLWVPFTFAK